MREIAFASARAMIREALPVILPRKIESVDAYALKHRRLANTGGGYVGPWRHDLTPYLVEPMQALTNHLLMTVALVGPGQVAKTVVAENWFLHSVGADPGDILWYMQTDEAVSSYVKSRINPMIEMHPIMVKSQGLRPVDDSLHFKRFRSMKIEFLSASLSNLINKSAPRIVGDEIDAYADFGDPMVQFNRRRQTFGKRSKVLVMSHCDKARGLKPDRDWTAGIMAIYADSDRCVWYWPCPHCGGWSSPCPLATRVMPLVYVTEGSLDDVEKSAHLLCPINGCVIGNDHRVAMNKRGRWIGIGQEISETGEVTGERIKRRTAGFWIVGVMSPFIIGGIGGLARELVKAQREFETDGDEASYREIVVKGLGIPYAPPKSIGSIDANDLAERAEPELKIGVVPVGVRFLTLAVDVQRARFEWLLRGWGIGGESWIVDRGKILAEPSTSKEDWDALLDLFTRAWPLGDGTGRGMTARAVAIDSAGEPGVTAQAYAAWTRWRKARTVRLFGTISGRDAWSIVLTKGVGTPNAAKLQVTYPDTTRRANVIAGAGHVPVASFNSNSFKDDLAGQLMKAKPGLGEPANQYIHFPYALRSPEQPHLWFEQVVAERRDKVGKWEKLTSSTRNEALDLLVMSHVAAHLHGLSRLDWVGGKLPRWAQDWDTNQTIVAAGGERVGPTLVTRGSAVIKPTSTPATPQSMDSFVDKFNK